MTERATFENIVNYFLYGQLSTPNHLTDRLRDLPPDATTDLAVDVATYMEGPGRFARAAAASIVQDFFNGNLDPSIGITDSNGVTRLTVGDLLASNGDDTDPIKIEVTQYFTGTNLGDYGHRAFIWGMTSFRLSDDTTFVWDNGSLRIDNLAILPFDTDFDFKSGNPIAKAINPYLEATLDPQGIGRTVLLEFDPVDKDAWSISSASNGYNIQDFANDNLYISSQHNPVGIGTLEGYWDIILDELKENNVVEYERGGRYIVYDSNGLDIVAPLDRASIVVAGSGNDVVYGSIFNDIIYGGSGDDTFKTSGGDDQFFGGDESEKPGYIDFDTVDYTGTLNPISINFVGASTLTAVTVFGDGTDTLHSIEKIIGTSGRDYLWINGTIAADTNLTIDASGGQAPNVAATINGGRATAGLEIHIDPGGSGTGYVRSVGGGQITLVGFHTQVIGSAYNDTITDNSDGGKWIDGGQGDDEISTAGTSASVILYGGQGSDILTGGSGNDVIDGGGDWGTLLGGGGDDLLISSDGDMNGGAGNDYLRARGNPGGLLEGGSGDDFIEAWVGTTSPADPGATIVFAKGDGHDTVLGQYVNDPTYWTNWEGFEGYTLTGIREIDLSSLSYDEIEFVWDATVVRAAAESEYILETFCVGNLAIVIKETGESIFIPGVAGVASWAPDENHNYINGIPRTDIDTSFIRFFDYNFLFEEGYFSSFGEGNAPSWYPAGAVVTTFRIGSAADYEIDLSEYTGHGVGEDLNFVGTSGDDAIDSDGRDGSLDGGDGNDNFTLKGGNVEIEGGNGIDQVTLFRSLGEYERSLDGGNLVLAGAFGSVDVASLHGVETIYSITDHSTYSVAALLSHFGTSGADNILGTEFRDVITGREGDDTISAGRGNDSVDGGEGDDTLSGGAGDDVLDGGNGEDTAIFLGLESEYQITIADGVITVQDLIDGRDGTDTLTNVEVLQFSDGTYGNDGPILVQPLVSVSVDEDQPIDFEVPTGTFADPDGDPLELSATLADGQALPAWLTFEDGRFLGMPPANYHGTLSVRVKASDGALSAVSSFDLEVVSVNDTPTTSIDPESSLSIGEGDPVGEVARVVAADPDGDTLAFSIDSGNGSGLFEIDEDGVITTTRAPASGEVGNHTLQILVDDGNGGTITTAVTIAVVGGTPPAIPYPQTTNTVAPVSYFTPGTSANDYFFIGESDDLTLAEGYDGDDHMVIERADSAASGGAGSDVIEARAEIKIAGDDEMDLYGNVVSQNAVREADYFVFDIATYVGPAWSLSPSSDWARIVDFDAGLDKIAILNSSASEFADLTIVQNGTDVEIYTSTMPMITLENVDVSDIGAGDFIFEDGGSSPGGGPAPVASIADRIFTEGGALVFTVTLSWASTETVTIDYATADGSATAIDDYVAASGTLTFAPGEVTKTITVTTVDDSVLEGTETLFLTLSNPSNAELAPDVSATGTLNDNDWTGSGVLPVPQTTNTVSSASPHMEGTTANDLFLIDINTAPTLAEGLAGDDHIVANNWNSALSGGAGSDVIEIRDYAKVAGDDQIDLYGNVESHAATRAADYFVFDIAAYTGPGWSLDPDSDWARVVDFDVNLDRIAVLNGGTGQDDFADLTIVQNGSDAEISAAGMPKIILENVDASQIGGASFIWA